MRTKLIAIAVCITLCTSCNTLSKLKKFGSFSMQENVKENIDSTGSKTVDSTSKREVTTLDSNSVVFTVDSGSITYNATAGTYTASGKNIKAAGTSVRRSKSIDTTSLHVQENGTKRGDLHRKYKAAVEEKESAKDKSTVPWFSIWSMAIILIVIALIVRYRVDLWKIIRTLLK